MKKFRTNDLKIGVSDDQLQSPRPGQAFLRVSTDGDLYVKMAGVAESQIGAPPPVEEPVSSLSDHSQQVVIDPNGSGDYTSLTAALDGVAVSDMPNTVFVVFGNVTETVPTTITRWGGGNVRIFITYGASISIDANYTIGSNVYIFGPGKLLIGKDRTFRCQMGTFFQDITLESFGNPFSGATPVLDLWGGAGSTFINVKQISNGVTCPTIKNTRTGYTRILELIDCHLPHSTIELDLISLSSTRSTIFSLTAATPKTISRQSVFFTKILVALPANVTLTGTAQSTIIINGVNAA